MTKSAATNYDEHYDRFRKQAADLHDDELEEVIDRIEETKNPPRSAETLAKLQAYEDELDER